MEDYKKYLNLDFKKEYHCPYKELEVGKCWNCQQFEYCVNRKITLAEAGIKNIEYTPKDANWLLREPMGMFEPGRFAISDNFVASSFLRSNICRKKGHF